MRRTLFTTQSIWSILLIAVYIVPMLFGVYASRVANAAYNGQINYQGKLTTASNIAVADGTYHMKFWLLTSPTAATTTAVWAEDRSAVAGDRVTLRSGLFSVMLGSSTSLASVDFNQTLYLAVEIGGSAGSPTWDGEMSPRKVLGAVPAAFEAGKVGGLAASQFLRSDTATSLASSSATTLLSITQNGTGDVLNVFDGSTRVFTILDGGNVGIGSSSPSAKLTVADGNIHVGGFITATSTATSTFTGGISMANFALTGSATSTAANGFNLSNGCYAINSICLPTGAGAFGTTSIDTSAKLASIVTDETGSGALVFANSATLSSTTLSGNTLMTNATSATFFATTASLTNLVSTNATTTGGVYIGGNVGMGSTSPFAKLSIHALASDTNTTLFAIASSTVTATTTLFTVSNTGDVVASGDIYSKGVRWSPSSATTTNIWFSVTYGNGLFVAVSLDGSGNRVMTSPDGINWTTRASAADSTWASVTYGNGLFVAVSAGNEGAGSEVMTSPDGINWTLRTAAANNIWWSVTYGNGLFVAVAASGSGNRVMTSPDGINWTARASAANSAWQSVTYGNGKFVAVSVGQEGVASEVMLSSDGISWATSTAAADNQWYSVTYGNGLFVAVAITGSGDRVMTSPDGVTWTARTSPVDGQWTSVTYGNGLFVAVDGGNSVGTSSQVMTSPNGIDWSLRASTAENEWESVTYGNGRFVAVSASSVTNNVMYSGTIENNAIATNNIYQGGMTVNGFLGLGSTTPYANLSLQAAVGNTNTTLFAISSSTNSANTSLFTISNTGSTTAANGFNITSGCYAINGTCLTSGGDFAGSFGTTSINTSAKLASIVTDETGSGALVFGTNATLASTTLSGLTLLTNATTTTLFSMTASSTNLFSSLANFTNATSGTFFATTASSTNLFAGTGFFTNATTTANQYIGSSLSVGSSSPYAKLSVHAVSTDTYTTLFAISSSTSATTTTLFTVSNTGDVTANGDIYSKGMRWASSTGATAAQWQSVTYGNGLFVAVNRSGTGNRVMTSPDGIVWTPRTSASDDNWKAVTYGNGLFVAISRSLNGLVMTSPDGINWTLRTGAANNQWNSITYGNGLFVVVGITGTGNRVMTSPDGIVWTSRTNPVDSAWQSVTYGNGLFVVVSSGSEGVGSEVMTSPDGITWTTQTAAANNTWESITYGNGLFVAVSDSGTGNRIMTSPDGINWTSRTSAADNSWSSITYGNGLFVAVASTGSGNRVMTSPDGINWTSRISSANNSWATVTYGNGLFVALSSGLTETNNVMYSGKQDVNQLAANNIYQGGMTINGFLGLGTTTPYANLSLAIPAGGTNTTVFAIASSTSTSTAPTSLFTISNTGSTTAANGFNIATGCYAVNGTCISNTANASQSGILSSTDWSVFNTKISSTSIDTESEFETLVGGLDFLTISTNDVSSANLITAVSDETGSGALVFGTNATLASTTLSGLTLLTNATTTTLFSTTASSTNLFSSLANFTNATSSTFFATTASSTNLFASNAYLTNLGMGSSTLSSLITLDKTTGLTGSVIAGVKEYFRFVNTSLSAVNYGDNAYIINASTATSTLVGGIIRIEDSSQLGNTIRGFEVQAHRGTTTKGENTALSGFGRTFGVRGSTEGDAGDTYLPAGVFAETRGTTQGNALRAYSGTITTEDLVSIFHDTSAFSGTGLAMDFGNSTGSFTQAGKFLDLQVSGTTKFKITSQGTTTIGDGTTSNQAGLQIGYGGLCVDNDGTCTASTTGRISSVSTYAGNSDLAEMYFSSQALEAGDIVATAGALSIGRADSASRTKVLGVVSTKPGLVIGADDTPMVAGQGVYPVGLSGRVPIKLSTEGGSIKAGDKIMLSSIPGVGMKATTSGEVVGVALEDFDGTRAYTDGFVNQFGDDLVSAQTVARDTHVDPRQGDGCYFGGGAALGEGDCQKKEELPFSDTFAQDEAAKKAAEAKKVAVQQLAFLGAATAETSGGQTVRVGKALLFVNLGMYQLAQDTDILTELRATTTLADGTETTLWENIKSLAQSFVHGALSILRLNVDEVYVKDKLCVDDVCMNANDLRELLKKANTPASSDPGAVVVDVSVEEQESSNTPAPAVTDSPVSPIPEVSVAPQAQEENISPEPAEVVVEEGAIPNDATAVAAEVTPEIPNEEASPAEPPPAASDPFIAPSSDQPVI